MDLNLLVPIFMFLTFIIIISTATSRRCWNKCRKQKIYLAPVVVTSQSFAPHNQSQPQYPVNLQTNVQQHPQFQSPPPPYYPQMNPSYGFNQSTMIHHQLTHEPSAPNLSMPVPYNTNNNNNAPYQINRI